LAVTSTTQGLRIVVTGLIAQHPSLGRGTWDYVQYAAGLQRLGHDVYYLEDSGEWPYIHRHAKAERDITATYFDSDRVLSNLVERAMANERHTELQRVAG
jgi:hypothetical protein